MKHWILMIAVSVMLVSCYTPRYMYSPTAQNVPILVKAGDSKLAAAYSTDLSWLPTDNGSNDNSNDRSNGFDLQGAVAVTNNFALQANYAKRTEYNNDNENYRDSSGIRYNRRLAEFGLGYFNSIHRNDKVLFQVFAGMGTGRSSFTDKGMDFNNVFYERHHQADMLKVYVQPAIIFRPRENFVLSVSSKLNFINFRNIKTDYTDAELNTYQLNDLPHSSRTFWEPAFTNSFGFNKLPGVRFEYQFSAALQVDERHIDYRSFNFGIGMMLDIPKMFRSGKTPE